MSGFIVRREKKGTITGMEAADSDQHVQEWMAGGNPALGYSVGSGSDRGSTSQGNHGSTTASNSETSVIYSIKMHPWHLTPAINKDVGLSHDSALVYPCPL